VVLRREQRQGTAVVGDRVWVGSDDGHLYCVGLQDGRVLWKTPAGSVWSSPCVVGNRVVFGSRDHNLYILDADTGRVVWKYALGGHCISTPCIVQGDIYLGSHGGDFHRFVPA
jgi:outer membrane protein assembly factor BamB